eukprot:1955590-Amphidinium_carterae.2
MAWKPFATWRVSCTGWQWCVSDMNLCLRCLACLCFGEQIMSLSSVRLHSALEQRSGLNLDVGWFSLCRKREADLNEALQREDGPAGAWQTPLRWYAMQISCVQSS